MRIKKQRAGNDELPDDATTYETITDDGDAVAEPEHTGPHGPAGLAGLMRKVVARRSRVRETQEKLRDIELELRQAPDDARSRFERMREAALLEYRAARAEAARTRNQLVMTLRLLPSRS